MRLNNEEKRQRQTCDQIMKKKDKDKHVTKY